MEVDKNLGSVSYLTMPLHSPDRVFVTKVMETETAHRLGCYSGKCSNVHGHSYRWEVTVSVASEVVDSGAATSTPGMGIDFSDLKKAMKIHIHDVFDHALIIWESDPSLQLLKELPDATGVRGNKLVVAPWNTTAENYARYVFSALVDYMKVNSFVKVEKVVCWETSNSYAEVIA